LKVETPNRYYYYLLELVTANSVQLRSFPSHFKIRPSATPVYGPSPWLSNTRLSGPTALVTWSNRAAWRLCSDPAMRTGEKCAEMPKSVRKVAARRLSLKFMFKINWGKVEHLKLIYNMCPPCMVLHKGPTEKNNILKTENLLRPYTHAAMQKNSSRVCIRGVLLKICSMMDWWWNFDLTRGFDNENFHSINNGFDKFYIMNFDPATFHVKWATQKVVHTTYRILIRLVIQINFLTIFLWVMLTYVLRHMLRSLKVEMFF